MSHADDLKAEIAIKKTLQHTTRDEIEALENDLETEIQAKVKYQCTECNIVVWGIPGLVVFHDPDHPLIEET